MPPKRHACRYTSDRSLLGSLLHRRAIWEGPSLYCLVCLRRCLPHAHWRLRPPAALWWFCSARDCASSHLTESPLRWRISCVQTVTWVMRLMMQSTRSSLQGCGCQETSSPSCVKVFCDCKGKEKSAKKGKGKDKDKGKKGKEAPKTPSKKFRRTMHGHQASDTRLLRSNVQ